ncbi:hypothetical protein [Nonomuraea sp. NPDC049784]|uniref:hypothetical protein n=1 Tax=Nonomuraea sp. NPDC049784 TaxID=3154361 RepID=UPI0033CBF1FE
MPVTSAAVLASGAKSAAKLLVAALAFTGAYAGFATAPDGAGATPEHVMTVTLSAREAPYTEQLEPRVTVNRSRAPKPSRTSVSR